MQAQFVEVIQKIKAYSAEWEKLLDPRWMRIEHIFIESRNDEDADTIADTDARWQYGHAEIRWFLPEAVALNDAALEGTVVHELVHVLMCAVEGKIPSKYEDLSEYTVESIARAFLSVRKAS